MERSDTDAALARAVERGGPDAGAAAGALFQRHLERVYSLCGRYFRVREDAEEAASEAMLRALRALMRGQYRGDAPLRAWLLRIASNVCVEQLRQPRLPTLSLEGYPGAAENLHAPACGPGHGAAERGAELAEAIAALPDDQGLAITLCDLEGYTAREASLILSRSPEAVKSLQARARRALRRMLESDAPENGERTS